MGHNLLSVINVSVNVWFYLCVYTDAFIIVGKRLDSKKILNLDTCIRSFSAYGAWSCDTSNYRIDTRIWSSILLAITIILLFCLYRVFTGNCGKVMSNNTAVYFYRSWWRSFEYKLKSFNKRLKNTPAIKKNAYVFY